MGSVFNAISSCTSESMEGKEKRENFVMLVEMGRKEKFDVVDLI